MVSKIILIGDAEVGKTNIISRYVDGEFLENNISTIGVEYKTKELDVNGEKILLQIWDTSGQEKYNAITKNYLRGSDVILFVFDVTKKESFDNINNWLKLSEGIEGNFVKILVGNKNDKGEKKISQEVIKNFYEKNNMKYFKISAKEDDNINELFEYITNLIEKKIPRRDTEDFSEEIEKENEKEKLNNPSNINSKSKHLKTEEKKIESTSKCC